ncbi:MAG: hypothetical protein V9F03_05280 [Microthrixaceae bacterium]
MTPFGAGDNGRRVAAPASAEQSQAVQAIVAFAPPALMKISPLCIT